MIVLLAKNPDSLGILIYLFPTIIALILIGIGAVKFFKNHEVSLDTIIKVAEAFYYNQAINQFITDELDQIAKDYKDGEITDNMGQIYSVLLDSLRRYLDGVYFNVRDGLETDEDIIEIYSELEKYKIPLSQIKILSQQVLLALGYDENKIKSYIKKSIRDNEEKEDENNGNKKDLS